MGKAFEILGRDLGRLIRNPLATVVVLAMCILPSLYTWYCDVAFWDPYGNTGNIPVAVASADEGYDLANLADELPVDASEGLGASSEAREENYVNIGEQLEDQLRENNQLKWIFVNEDEAIQGVKAGDYYAAIVIPEGFTNQLIQVILQNSDDMPKIQYYVNEKSNAVAPKITDAGSRTIQQQINSSFVELLTQTILETLQSAGFDLDASATDAEQTLTRKLSGVQGSLDEVQASLDGLGESVSKARTATADARLTLTDLQATLPTIVSGVNQADDLLGDIRTQGGAYATEASAALGEGASKLGGASAQASSTVGAASADVLTLKAKVDAAIEAMQDVIDRNTETIAELQDIVDAASARLEEATGDDTVLDPESPLSGITDETGQIAQDAIDDAQAIIDRLTAENAKYQDVVDRLTRASDNLGAVATSTDASVEQIDAAVQNAIAVLGGAQTTFNTDLLPQLSSGLDSLSSAGSNMTAAAAGADTTIDQAVASLDALDGILDQTETSLSTWQDDIQRIQDRLDGIATDIRSLYNANSLETLAGLLGMDVQEIASFIASPVTLTTEKVYPVESYGSSVNPFFTNLSLWIGGLVLIAILKVEVDRTGLGDIKPYQAYLGRWLFFVLIGIVQSIVLCTGELLIGVQCNHVPAMYLAAMVASVVYVSISYSLTITFKHIGKAIAVMLLIAQIPGGSGMYPAEMLPDFYQRLHPLVPFTYGINAMREAMFGFYGNYYVHNLLVLALFFIPTLIVGIALRPYLMNINLLFDHELKSTGVMIHEEHTIGIERFRMRTIIRALMNADEYRSQLTVRAAQFDAYYPIMRRLGLIFMISLPLIPLTVMAVVDLGIDGRIAALVLWILLVIFTVAMLIMLEYAKTNISNQMKLNGMSQDELAASLAMHANMTRTGHALKLSKLLTRMAGIQTDQSEATGPVRNAATEAVLADAAASEAEPEPAAEPEPVTNEDKDGSHA
ncbi:YhgE/Pip domain-containing protein [Slackia heliotrinireducens]|uniref:YhgE/Pip domain-containing protein n=1 Tax=Slackia heliotrinireducens TaxID=84110 RepID=UPI00331632CE